MIYVVLLIVALTTVLMAVSQLTTAQLVNCNRFEAEAAANRAFDGAIDRIICDWKLGAFTIPGSRSYTIGSGIVEASITAGPVPRTMTVSAVVSVKAWKYRRSQIIGQRVDPHPVFFALFSSQPTIVRQNMILGSAGVNGDSYVGGLSFLSTGRAYVNGDLDSEDPVDFSKVALLSGTRWAPAPAIPMPGIPLLRAQEYMLAANVKRTGRIEDVAFPPESGGFCYTIHAAPLLDALGLIVLEPVSIRGGFSGKGVIFVNGDVTIENISYASAGSRLVVIATGDITFESSGATNGHFYTIGDALTSGGGDRTITGSVACRVFDTGNAPCTIIHDPYFWDTPSEARAFRMPGFWP